MATNTAENLSDAIITHWPQLYKPTGRLIAQPSWPAWFAILSSPSEWQGDAHPGWSAGSFRDHKRAKANVEFLSALVLDMETPAGDPALWARFYGLIHSTKRSTAEDPRFRVVLPFNRRVTPGEYSRIWKHMAAWAAGHGARVDESTKDPSRLWYYPSSGPHFWTRELTGAVFDADRCLDQAAEKTRVVPIRSDVTIPKTRADDARLYLDKIPGAVSGERGHDATFRVACILVKGFDLTVDQARPLLAEWNARCQPPWSDSHLDHKLADAERANLPRGYILAKRLDRVRALDAEHYTDAERSAIRAEGCGDLEITETELADDGWRAYCETTAKGAVKPSVVSALAILTRHPALQGSLEWDALADLPQWRIAPPWGTVGPLTDDDTTKFNVWLALTLGVGGWAKLHLWDALIAAARERTVDPVKAWLTSLSWDGVPRLDTWLGHAIGRADTRTSAIGRYFLLSAVARALNPGCKVDTVLVLEGPQGGYKSTLIRELFGAEWTKDTPVDLLSKDRFTALRGAWGYELAEFDDWTQHDESRVKQFITSPVDTYRPPYGRSDVAVPRRVVFVGTTNQCDYLKDRTGGRRFWPVACARIDLAWVRANRSQLWAEATLAYQSEVGQERTARSRWWPDETEARAFAEAVRERTETDDGIMDTIAAWLTGRDECRMLEVMVKCLEVDVQHRTKVLERRIGACMHKLGWSRIIEKQDGKATRVWRKDVSL